MIGIACELFSIYVIKRMEGRYFSFTGRRSLWKWNDGSRG